MNTKTEIGLPPIPIEPCQEEKQDRFITIKNDEPIIETDKFNAKDADNKTKETLLTYIHKEYPHILGEALFHTDQGAHSEQVYRFKSLRTTREKNGEIVIVKDIYRLPSNEWVARVHKGSMANPKRTVYLKINADEAKRAFEHEIHHTEYSDTKKILREKIKQHFSD